MLNKMVKKAGKISILLALMLGLVGFVAPSANAALVITTNYANGITYQSAVLNGILNEGSLSINAWFELGTNPNNLNIATTPRYYNSLSSSFNALVTGLVSNTTYFYRAVAENYEGRVYGNILSFTTSFYDPNYNTSNTTAYTGAGVAPSVNTVGASGMGPMSATLNGVVNGGGLPSSAWFEWGTTTSFNNSTAQNSYGGGTQAYNTTLVNLSPSTTYYFRSVAQNAQGRVFSNTLSFTTLSSAYIVNTPVNTPNQILSAELKTGTNPATSVGSTSAKLNSLITNVGTTASNTWFEWGKTNALGNKTETISTGNVARVKHVGRITGLTPNTTYYFRPVVESVYGKTFGEIYFFKTLETSTGITESTDNKSTVTPADENDLGASAVVAGFLPGNLFGWMLAIMFILLLVLLAEQIFLAKKTPEAEVQAMHH